MTRRRRLILAAGAVAATGGLGTAVALGLGTEEPPLPPPQPAATPAPEPPPPPPEPLPESRAQLVLPEAGGAPATAENVAPGDEPAADAPAGDASDDPGEPPPGDPTLEGGDELRKATVLENGIALPPLDAPAAVTAIIEAGNIIARSPYKWGGGHGRWQDSGYDCSGSVSYALASAGLIGASMPSGSYMRWGKPGKGKWVTIYTNPGHMFMEVAGVRFDTSGRQRTGSRWQEVRRSTAGYVARHPPGL